MTRKAPEMDREAALVRAAKTRALITGHMNKPGQTPHSLQDLLANVPELVKLHKHTPATLDRIVRQMVKNNQMIRNSEQRIHTFYLPTGIEVFDPKVKRRRQANWNLNYRFSMPPLSKQPAVSAFKCRG